MPGAYTFEEIPPFRLCVSREHRFGTDAFLLAGFSRPRQGEKVCDLCSGCGIIPLLWLRRERRPWVAYGVELLEHTQDFPKEAPLLIITDCECDRLNLYGRDHAFLVPRGRSLPFPPRGPVFYLE